MTIRIVNHMPHATNASQTVSVNEDTGIATIDLGFPPSTPSYKPNAPNYEPSPSTAAFDPDGDALTFEIVSMSPNGSLQINSAGNYFFTWPADVVRHDGNGDPVYAAPPVTVVYKVNDGVVDSNLAGGGQDPYGIGPGASDGQVTVAEDAFLQSSLGGQGCATAKTVPTALEQIVDGPHHYQSLTLHPPGTVNGEQFSLPYTYVPESGFTGEDWFTFTLRDDVGDVSNYATIFITVVNDFVTIDSNNDGHLAATPAGERLQDTFRKQQSTLPGKIVPLGGIAASYNEEAIATSGDRGDIDADGIPDFADGYNWDKVPDEGTDSKDDDSADGYSVPVFAPLLVTLPDTFDPDYGRIELSYSDSDPAAVVRNGPGTDLDPYEYDLPSGPDNALRVWTGREDRTWRSVHDRNANDVNDQEQGFYVPSGTYSKAELSTWSGYSWSFTGKLYVERVQPSQNLDDRTISVRFDLDGSGHWSAWDYVLVGDQATLEIDATNTASGMPNLNSDGTHNDAMADYSHKIHDDPSLPGKIMVVNDGDLDGNEIPDFADGVSGNEWTSGTTHPKFVPMVITLPAGNDPDLAWLRLDYDGSDPAHVRCVGSQPDRGYKAAPGSLRIWRQDGNVERSDRGVTDDSPGDYVTPGVPFKASLLEWPTDEGWHTNENGDQQAVVYIEAVRPSAEVGDLRIELYADPNGYGPFGFSDAVRVTAVQDTAPDYGVAGGVMSVAAGADGGDPMAGTYSGAVRLCDGTVHLAAADLSVTGYGHAWGVTRVWSSQVAAALNPSFGNGVSIAEFPQLIQGSSVIIAAIGGQEFFFDQVSAGVYKERFFGLDVLTYNSSNHVYQLADTTGNRILFNDFKVENTSDPTYHMYKRGAFKQLTDADGNQITASVYDTLGNITAVTHGADTFTFEYQPCGPHAEKLVQVTLTRAAKTIGKADYTYYGEDDLYGNEGDLKRVQIFQDSGSGGLTRVEGSYYRCFTEDDEHGLQYVVSGSGYARTTQQPPSPPPTTQKIHEPRDYMYWGRPMPGKM